MNGEPAFVERAAAVLALLCVVLFKVFLRHPVEFVDLGLCLAANSGRGDAISRR